MTTCLTSSIFFRQAESIALRTFGRIASVPFLTWKARSQRSLRTGKVGPTRSTSVVSSESNSVPKQVSHQGRKEREKCVRTSIKAESDTVELFSYFSRVDVGDIGKRREGRFD